MDSKFRYIDTHAHLNIQAYNEDLGEVIDRCKDEKVAVINVGTKLSTSKKAVEIAQEADNCYAIVGLHPIQTNQADHDEEEIGEGGKTFISQGEEFDAEAFRQLAKHEKVVAVGECGFDYYRCDKSTWELQETAFIQQIELANELKLPLMIHTRDAAGNSASASATGHSAYDDVYDVLKKHAKTNGNIHFYAGTYEQAKKFFDLGFTVSFTGVITFSSDYNETIKNTPLSMLHAETDSPFVSPVPHRGKRAEPWMVKEVYKKIAELKGEDEESVRQQLVENAYNHYLKILR